MKTREIMACFVQSAAFVLLAASCGHPNPPPSNPCPPGVSAEVSQSVNEACGGKASGSVVTQSGQIQGLCERKGDQLVLCKPDPQICGSAGIRRITKDGVDCKEAPNGADAPSATDGQKGSGLPASGYYRVIDHTEESPKLFCVQIEVGNGTANVNLWDPDAQSWQKGVSTAVQSGKTITFRMPGEPDDEAELQDNGVAKIGRTVMHKVDQGRCVERRADESATQ